MCSGAIETLLGIMKDSCTRSGCCLRQHELQRTLQCAQDNATTSAQHLTKSIEPIGAILKLASPLMGLAGVGPIEFPTIGSETDVKSLEELVKTLQGVVGTLQIVAEVIPPPGPCS